MADQNKPTSTMLNSALTPTKKDDTIAKSHTVKLPGLHARLHRAAQNPALDCATLDNRLALLLDCSGSMNGYNIEQLREACVAFISACNMKDTALAVECFPSDSSTRVALTNFQPMLTTTVMTLESHGGTPMADAMDYVINNYSLTRGVLVSDGQPDSETRAYQIAEHFKEAGIPVDCVHIDQSTCGEACLQRIAEITGGLYIKFKDVASFAKSFKYLSPRYYAMLSDGTLSKSILGADELK